jgi:hypothetical protein
MDMGPGPGSPRVVVVASFPPKVPLLSDFVVPQAVATSEPIATTANILNARDRTTNRTPEEKREVGGSVDMRL